MIQSDTYKTVSGRIESMIEPLRRVDKSASAKIKTIDTLSKILAEYKDNGKRIVQCHGVFDLIHLGHIRYFNSAKKEGDILVVTLTADKHVKRGPGRPFFNERLRAETLASLAVTDFVAIADSATAIESIKVIKPDIYAKGPDSKDKDKDVTGKIYDEEEAVKSVGGKLFITDDRTFSSSKLINDYFDVYPPEIREYLNCIRQKYTADFVTEKLYSLNKLKVLVIGDTIIDQYHYCVPMGKSSKEPIVANRYISDESFAGGSLATANNLASVCGSVDLLTVLGKQNSFEEFITERLSPNIVPYYFYREDVGTIVKRRYVTHGTCRKLFEICYIDDGEIPPVLQTAIQEHLRQVISEYDLVVVNDFGHGLLSGEIIDFVARHSKYLAINVQTNGANIGFNLVTKYPRADCVCIDEAEMRFATHDRYGDLKSHTKEIYERLDCKCIITTRGANGALCYSDSEGYVETPAFSYRVVDAIGAGDAFFAFIAPCFAAGLPQDLVTFVGNAVGSLAVQIVCNREPVKLEDLIKFITRLLK